MRLAIMCPDHMVIIEGEALIVDCSNLPRGRELVLDKGLTSERREVVNLHAMQWYGDHGEIQWANDKGHVVYNEPIDCITMFEGHIAQWREQKKRVDAERTAREEAEARMRAVEDELARDPVRAEREAEEVAELEKQMANDPRRVAR